MLQRWDLSPDEMRAMQQQLAQRVVRENRLGPVTTVAGVAVTGRGKLVTAATVLLSYPELEVISHVVVSQPVDFPYIPGLRAFREGPVILAALAKLRPASCLLLVAGHGVAHPRRLGLASHLGVLLDLPAIGCAKLKLCGGYAQPEVEPGSYTLLFEQGETIGAVVRSRRGTKPIFVSVGHRLDLPTAIGYVLDCCCGYRLPEPIRWAQHLARGSAQVGHQPRLTQDR